MFRSLFRHLYDTAQNPELKEHIAAIRDSEKIHAPIESGKAHRSVHGAFTWIGNIAREYGEPEIGTMAREMRDENLDKFEKEF